MRDILSFIVNTGMQVYHRNEAGLKASPNSNEAELIMIAGCNYAYEVEEDDRCIGCLRGDCGLGRRKAMSSEIAENIGAFGGDEKKKLQKFCCLASVSAG